MTFKQTWPLLFFVSLLLAATLPVAYGVKYGAAAGLTAFQGDAFYYLGITQRSQHFAGFSFDGLWPTNGFHPLWEWLLAGLARVHVLNFEDTLQVVRRVYMLDALLLGLASGIFCVAASAAMSRRWLALLICSPGPLWLGVALATPNYGASWSSMNGMESAITFLCFAMSLAALRWWDERPSVGLALLVSVLLGLTVLARLDEIFLAASIVAWMFARVRNQKMTAWTVATAAVLPLSGMLGTYLIYNYAAVGAMLPLSGAAKAGLSGWGNLHHLAWLLQPVRHGLPPNMLQPGSGVFIFGETYMRMAQMVLPPLVCVIELYRQRGSRFSSWSVPLCVGVLLKAGYNFAFVALFHQGSWYFTVSFAIANLFIVRWLDEALGRLFPNRFSLEVRLGSTLVYLAFVLLSFNMYLTPIKSSYGSDRLALVGDGWRLGQELRRNGDSRILEFTDGVISYGLRLPAEAAFGLVLDAQAAAALKNGTFLDLMEQRNITLAASQSNYSEEMAKYLVNSYWAQGIPLYGIQAKEFGHHTFVFLRHDPTYNIDFYRLQRR